MSVDSVKASKVSGAYARVVAGLQSHSPQKSKPGRGDREKSKGEIKKTYQNDHNAVWVKTDKFLMSTPLPINFSELPLPYTNKQKNLDIYIPARWGIIRL